MFTEYLDRHNLSELLGAPGSYQPFPRRQNRAAWEGLNERIRKELVQWGDEALAGYPMLTATQYLAFRRVGDRQGFEKPYFDRRKLLIGATFAECVLDDGAHLDAIIDGLWAICEESSWVISAHNDAKHPWIPEAEREPLPDIANPYVDLFSAQTAATLSFVLYFMEDKLDAVSPRIARRVRAELESRVLGPFDAHDDFWWMGVIRKDVNNWTPWILSNILCTVLLMERDALRRCRTTARAMRMLDAYLAVMPQDGGCDEGAGYFNMAGSSLLDCLEAICEATEGRVSFYHEPHIRSIGTYPVKAHIAGPYFLNFADCDCKPMLDDMPLIRYGRRTQNPELTALGVSIHEATGGVIRVKDTPQMNRCLYAIFDAVPALEDVPAPGFMQMPDLQVFAWRKNGLYAAIKGGTNGESHNHNDIGTFVVYADGEPVVIDMGNKVYTAKTFGPERYTLDNTRAMNHNIPLIGGVEQQEGREYHAVVNRADERGAELDLTAAYPCEAGVQKIVRRFTLEESGAALHDVIVLCGAKEVTWVFMLRQMPVCGAGRVTFGSLALMHDPALEQQVSEIPVTDARLERNFPGSLWRLTLTAKAAALHDQHFEIVRS